MDQLLRRGSVRSTSREKATSCWSSVMDSRWHEKERQENYGYLSKNLVAAMQYEKWLHIHINRITPGDMPEFRGGRAVEHVFFHDGGCGCYCLPGWLSVWRTYAYKPNASLGTEKKWQLHFGSEEKPIVGVWDYSLYRTGRCEDQIYCILSKIHLLHHSLIN